MYIKSLVHLAFLGFIDNCLSSSKFKYFSF